MARVLGRKRGYDAFHLRQFLTRMQIAPNILVPVGQTAEPLALHDGDIFYVVLSSLPEPLCILTCRNVAHGFCDNRFGPRVKSQSINADIYF